MKLHTITEEKIKAYDHYLTREERAAGTIQKYIHDLRQFASWTAGRNVCKELVAQWKETLCLSGRAPVTVNASLAALHSFFAFQGWGDCRVKYLKLQRRAFRDTSRELEKCEYTRLVETARSRGKRRLALILETICATGVRVSEVPYITVEAAQKGRADVSLKGKIRTILIPGKLAKKLLNYARIQKISHGEIFLTAGGRSLSRHQIWREMKALCREAEVEAAKVFPHNLRHLFARAFYTASRDIVRLADVLGHSSIETTRIYLTTTAQEHIRHLEGLGLLL